MKEDIGGPPVEPAPDTTSPDNDWPGDEGITIIKRSPPDNVSHPGE